MMFTYLFAQFSSSETVTQVRYTKKNLSFKLNLRKFLCFTVFNIFGPNFLSSDFNLQIPILEDVSFPVLYCHDFHLDFRFFFFSSHTSSTNGQQF
jgi:hypothetical protein